MSSSVISMPSPIWPISRRKRRSWPWSIGIVLVRCDCRPKRRIGTPRARIPSRRLEHLVRSRLHPGHALLHRVLVPACRPPAGRSRAGCGRRGRRSRGRARPARALAQAPPGRLALLRQHLVDHVPGGDLPAITAGHGLDPAAQEILGLGGGGPGRAAGAPRAAAPRARPGYARACAGRCRGRSAPARRPARNRSCPARAAPPPSSSRCRRPAYRPPAPPPAGRRESRRSGKPGTSVP